MSDKVSGLHLSPARIGYLLSFIALMTVGWNAVDYFVAGRAEQTTRDVVQDMKIERNADSVAQLKSSFDRLTGETQNLTIAVTRLTTVIESNQATQKTNYQPRFFWENRDVASSNGVTQQ